MSIPASGPPQIPKKTTVLVVGGGPAGSYAASVLARDGIDVVVLDMSKFPRYHIGESLLPSIRHYLRFIDAEEKMINYGFMRKPGSAIKFNHYMREGYTDFVALGASNSAWNVVRSEFDKLLLDHAAESGASVFTQTRVESLEFAQTSPPASVYAASRPVPPPFCTTAPVPPTATSRQSPPPSPSAYQSKFSWSWGSSAAASGTDASADSSSSRSRSNSAPDDMSTKRPVRASYVSASGDRGEIEFDYLIDASGRNGLMSTKYLKNRRFNQSLKNVAVWGYWRGTKMYGEGTPRQNAPFFEALSDESGWAWFIPLHNGLTSVGVVMEQKALGIRSRAASSATTAPLPPSDGTQVHATGRTNTTLADRYLTYLHLAPGVQALIGDNATLERVTDENGEAPAARSASDFSYQADEYAGCGWRIAGDAGAFIDPFFSSGVHLAMTGAISAAATIAASIRGDCTEAEAAAWHNKRVAISYTRFLVVVLSAYKQIRAQSTNVLVDIDEDNFDKAFDFFRPVIQGGADMGKKLSEDEVQRALDFCVHLFSPTTPEQHEAVRQKLMETEKQWAPNEEDELRTCAGTIQADKPQHEPPTAPKQSSIPSPSHNSHAHHGRVNVTRPRSHTYAAPEKVRTTVSADRLLDVTRPIIDPLALGRLLRARLSFLRRHSSNSVNSLASTASSSAASSSICTCTSPPPSPVSAVFSFVSGASSSTWGGGDSDAGSGVLCPEHGGNVNDEHGPRKHAGGDREADNTENEEEEEEGDTEVRMVLDKVNARRVIHAEHGEGLNSLEQEAVASGLVVRLVRGELGLVAAPLSDI